MSEIRLTNEEIEKRINNAYLDGRADAIDEFASVLHKAIRLDKNLNHHDIDFLAEMVKEQKE